MHDDSKLVLERINRFLGERITPNVYAERTPLALTAWDVPDEPVPFAEAVTHTFEEFTAGSPWSKPWGTTWFHVTGGVPDAWPEASDRHRREVVIDLGFSGDGPGFQAEGLVFAPDGTTIKAVEPFNTAVAIASDTVDFYIEAASNPNIAGSWAWGPTPLGDKATAGSSPIYTLRYVDVAVRDTIVWGLEQDVKALLGLHAELPPQSTRAAQILRALERMCDGMDPHDIAGTAEAGRAIVAGVLSAEAAAEAHHITAVGHAHIDSAWLWPTRETIRKCARTFSNVLALMDDYPDFRFACSSAQQYAWIKQFYPQLFERIRVRVAEGRFIPVGGMWVESDTNMVGGEAMARQFVAGQGFFEREFGIRSITGWLPDSFGYTGALPQILAGAGLEQFVTQKISWNDTDRFPHHTFLWEGIDGTRMFTHFPPMDTYNSNLSGAELAKQDRQYAEKGAANSSLALFGHGDGGGGPTREMMEAAHRTASLEGSPRVAVDTPESFFTRAKAEYEHPPVWSGELYLELHRGTYTSQARTKQGNRRSEHLLREAELWATTAAVRTGADYPYEALRGAWETTLLQQFHDILPGSSIAWVHQEAERNYAALADTVGELIDASLARLGGDPAGDREAVVGGVLANASPLPVRGVPALGAALADVDEPVTVRRDGDGVVLENAQARFVLDARGRVISAVDLATGREAVAPGQSAGLELFRDTPTRWDAWDIDEYYRRHEHDIEATDVQIDEESGIASAHFSVGASSIVQEFALEAGSATLLVTTRVDWKERQQLLKFAFPADVRAERSAAETQFGHVYRATHDNTSWDHARFEICAHRWVHVGEPGFGVAVANDSTYGHDVTQQPRRGGGTFALVRQSLLRAPVYPDPTADQGEHVMRSSITVGAEISDAIAAGYGLNLPLRRVAAPIEPLVDIEGEGVLVESVKLAEDRSGDVVVRLYEAHGRRAEAAVTFRFDAVSVEPTDLLERRIETDSVTVSAAAAHLSLRPFEIATLRVHRG
ncbi:alpha-mannosidase [Rathayibacter soli]|uniref:alpha-mannosidase n=1 Tax=Rathayibacter soli TaxID=3144168 RepID=UPI0027E3CCA9|nr:glycoside hydrolase family 38 C-terminal domain-containing protein [Glaciibacter superstes]